MPGPCPRSPRSSQQVVSPHLCNMLAWVSQHDMHGMRMDSSKPSIMSTIDMRPPGLQAHDRHDLSSPACACRQHGVPGRYYPTINTLNTLHCLRRPCLSAT